MPDVIILPVMSDNYCYLVPLGNKTAVCVDPCEARPVVDALDKHGLTLAAILATHHHGDHTAGVSELARRYTCDVLAGDKHVGDTTRLLRDNDDITLGNLTLRAIHTPGHTKGSFCYLLSDDAAPVLFSGDTLFVGGCGRLFEDSAEQMWAALRRLADLDEATRVYCGHEYTLENYEFALSILPDDAAIRTQYEQTRSVLNRGGYSVPSTIAREKQTNIFLRADEEAIRQALNMPGRPASEVFARLRALKDRF